MTTSFRPGATGTTDPLAAGAAGTAPDHPLLERARAIGPTIRAHAAETERERRIARPVLDAMRDAGLLRMLVPRALGGFELDPVTCARVVEEVAGFDSAAGWALQTSATGAWWSSRLPDAGAAELFAGGPDVAMAASFHPPHRAVEAPGGYRFTGRGPLASNIHDAAWVMMTGLVMDGDAPRVHEGVPEIVALLLRASDVEIVDTWHSLGMRGTDSNDVVATDAFVPSARAFHLSPEPVLGAHFKGPLYRLPAVCSVALVVVPVALAIARGAIDAVRDLAARKTPFGSMKPLRDRASAQAAVAEAEGILRSARLLFHDTLAAAWRRGLAGEPHTLEQRADLLLAGAHAVRGASRVAELMHRVGGTAGIYARSPLERHFRDAQTVRHHGFLNESRLEAVGQVYLGVPPEFVMVAF
jgi:alkylation response protein AidB-like acyl-CoA dehydrogenase